MMGLRVGLWGVFVGFTGLGMNFGGLVIKGLAGFGLMGVLGGSMVTSLWR